MLVIAVDLAEVTAATIHSFVAAPSEHGIVPTLFCFDAIFELNLLLSFVVFVVNEVILIKFTAHQRMFGASASI